VTVYHYRVYAAAPRSSDGLLQGLAGIHVDAYLPDTTTVATGLTQNSVAVSFLTTGTDGTLTFQADVPIVDLSSPSSSFERRVEADENIGGVGSGVTDHGALTGLADDDHPQYAMVADAVPLATTTPSAPTTAGFAGTANTAAHGDHAHPAQVLATAPSILKLSGVWLTPNYGTSTTRTSGAINVMYLCPYYLRVADGTTPSSSQWAVNVATVGSGDSTVRFGLYPATTAGLPDWPNKLFDSGEVATASGTGAKTYTATVSLPPGLYWAVHVPHGTTAAVFEGASYESLQPRVYDVTAGVAIAQKSLKVTGVTGALPTTTPTLVSAGEPPIQLFVKLA
jgi:hypothetical protein